MGSYVTRTHAAGVSGLRTGPFGRWADGVTAMRGENDWRGGPSGRYTSGMTAMVRLLLVAPR
jgi:hypothetical protein